MNDTSYRREGEIAPRADDTTVLHVYREPEGLWEWQSSPIERNRRFPTHWQIALNGQGSDGPSPTISRRDHMNADGTNADTQVDGARYLAKGTNSRGAMDE
jgi:hypothetical protein